MATFRLPVAGIDVVLRAPAGSEDILLLEAGPPDLRVALALIERVLRDAGGAPIDPAGLPLTDIDALLLHLRRRLIGDVVSAEERCAVPTCGARGDITFSIAAYLDHHQPSPPAGCARRDDGWYQLDGGVELRAPTAADQLDIARAADPAEALYARCVRGTDADDPDARDALDEALESLAPSLCGDLEGVCPECGSTVKATFDPVQFVLRELRDQAAFVYEDVCAIAHHYHWSEAEILALPSARRSRYAELAAVHLARAGA